MKNLKFFALLVALLVLFTPVLAWAQYSYTYSESGGPYGTSYNYTESFNGYGGGAYYGPSVGDAIWYGGKALIGACSRED